MRVCDCEGGAEGAALLRAKWALKAALTMAVNAMAPQPKPLVPGRTLARSA